MATPNTGIRKALIKLLVAAAVLIGLILGCFSPIDRELVGIMAGFTILLAFPITVLLSVDASRIIKREMPRKKSVRILGVVLGIPQAVLGTILVAFGIVYPFIGIRDILADLSSGRSGIIPFLTTVTAILMLGVGYYYLREGLGLGKDSDKRE